MLDSLVLLVADLPKVCRAANIERESESTRVENTRRALKFSTSSNFISCVLDSLVFARGRPSKGRLTREFFTLPPSQNSFTGGPLPGARYSALYPVKRVPRGGLQVQSETPASLETVQRNSKELPMKSVTRTDRKGGGTDWT